MLNYKFVHYDIPQKKLEEIIKQYNLETIKTEYDKEVFIYLKAKEKISNNTGPSIRAGSTVARYKVENQLLDIDLKLDIPKFYKGE